MRREKGKEKNSMTTDKKKLDQKKRNKQKTAFMPNFFCFLFLFPLFREGVSYSFQRERTWGPGGK